MNEIDDDDNQNEDQDLAELEKEFRELVSTVGNEIAEKLERAQALVSEACALADEHGIPFYAGVSEIGQPYVPTKFEEKFKALDDDLLEELINLSGYQLEDGGGWRHSDVC